MTFGKVRGMGSKEHNSSYDPVIVRAFCRLDRMVPGRRLNIGVRLPPLPLGTEAHADDEQSLRPKISPQDSLGPDAGHWVMVQ